jgi:hypothetical protein
MKRESAKGSSAGDPVRIDPQQMPFFSTETDGRRSGCFGPPVHALAPSSERLVQSVAAAEKREHWLPADAELLKRATYPEISPCGHESLLESSNRLRRLSGLVIHFGEIQVQLGVVVLHDQSLLAECLSVAMALFGEGGEQTCVGKVEGVLGGCSERSPGVQQSFFDVSVT